MTHHRGRRVLLLLFGITLGPFLLVLPASVWLAWTLTPLQKFYLGTYTTSSLESSQPRTMTSIRWVLKTAPGRKSVPMLPQDAIAGPNRKLPVSLSAQAVAEGWRGVALASPERVPSSELAPLLRDCFEVSFKPRSEARHCVAQRSPTDALAFRYTALAGCIPMEGAALE